jgi:hypothetical protein
MHFIFSSKSLAVGNGSEICINSSNKPNCSKRTKALGEKDNAEPISEYFKTKSINVLLATCQYQLLAPGFNDLEKRRHKHPYLKALVQKCVLE